MGTSSSAEAKIDEGNTIAVEKELILEEIKFHLQSLSSSTESISSSSDAQYWLVQNFFDGKGELSQTADQLRLLRHDNINENEKMTLAYLQDDICVQATSINTTVKHLQQLFNRNFGSSVDKQDKGQHNRGSKKKIKLEGNENKTRFELNYLRSQYEEQKRELQNTQMKIMKMCHGDSEPEISGRSQANDKGQSIDLVLEISQLKDDLCRKEEELRRKNGEIKKMLEEHKKNSTQEKQRLEEARNDLNWKIKNLSRDVDNEKQKAKADKRSFEEEKEKYKSQINDLKMELQRLKGRMEAERVQKTVCLYTQRKSDLLSKVLVELKDMLDVTFHTQNMSLRIIECENSTEIEPNKPVLVLCINASRIGTDVSNALSGLHADSRVAVVVLHHKEIHALPNQSSERVLTAPEYKSLGSIVDMAFLSNKGIYTCDMNNTALSAIVEFIKQRN